MPRSVGIRELADDLGVSIGSVSNAINHPNLVSEKMRERVLEAAERLGFVRNELARQLRAGAGTTIGMIVLDIANPFFATLASVCQEAAEAKGLNLIMASSNQDEAREARLLHLFEQQRVRGLVIAPVNGPSRSMSLVQQRGMSMVLFDDSHPSAEFCSVAMNGFVAGQKAVEHLASKGRRRIMFVGGPMGQVSDRFKGAQHVCEALGIQLEYTDTVAQTVVFGRLAGEHIFQGREPIPDGIFAANDVLALGLLQAIQARPELRIPRDLSIVSVDDSEYAASAIIPLTTLRQPLDKLANSAIDLLEMHVHNDHAHAHLGLEPELVVRASS